MGSRAIKKLLKNDLESPEWTVSDESDSEVERKPKINPFSLLNQDESSGSEAEDEYEKESVAEPINSTSVAPPVSSSSKKSKKKKKKTKKSRQTQTREDDSALDSLIAELKAQDIQDTEDLSYIEAFKVDTRHLDYEREYKQLFGKAALAQSSTTTDSMSLPPGVQRPRDWGGRDGKTIPGTSRKLILTRIRDSFPPVSRRDILMEQLSGEGAGSIKEFKFIHSAAYMEAEKAFQVLSTIGDLDALVAHTMKETPYHVSTLLLLADFKTSNGQHSEAGQLIEQCLLAYDRSFRIGFDVTSGTCRLPFRYFENRAFYLTIFKHLKSLMRRGTWATAFEFDKLLWSLEPEDDPMGAGFMIDFFAINAGQCQYILELAENDYFIKKHHSLRPNIVYSRALAYHQKHPEDVVQTTQYILEAVRKFPWVAAAILDGDLSQSPVFGVEAGPEQAIYSGLYATQMKTFWQGTIRQMLSDVCQRLDLDLDPVKQAEGVSINVARFALLSEQSQVYSLIPAEYLSKTMFANDILPPLDDISPYVSRNT
jgi:Transcriptional repressor TCF25